MTKKAHIFSKEKPHSALCDGTWAEEMDKDGWPYKVRASRAQSFACDDKSELCHECLREADFFLKLYRSKSRGKGEQG